jgi:gamma-glutamylcyclotransferase (GGCT)/AIG2-like uncharacterized protein YtfP
MNSLYFAYGSNMNFDQMTIRCPESVFLSPAYLKDWRYFINGDGYAGIKKNKNSVTYGCLWKLNKRHWQSLDHYEAVDEGFYSLFDVMVTTEIYGVEELVTTYLSNNQIFGIPSTSYQKGVIEGAGQAGLPDNYIQTLESWKNGCPDRYDMDL